MQDKKYTRAKIELENKCNKLNKNSICKLTGKRCNNKTEYDHDDKIYIVTCEYR